MKIKKLLAGVLSAIISATPMFAVPTNTFAETVALNASASDTLFSVSEEDVYYSDSSNIAWTYEEYICYKNGVVISVYNTEYSVLLEHSANTALTDAMLELPEEYSVKKGSGWYETETDGQLSSVETKTYKEAVEIGKLANAWLENGLVNKAEIMTCNFYSCAYDMSFYVELNNPANETIDFAAYGFSEDNIRTNSDGTYICTVPQSEITDWENISNIRYALESNSKVKSVVIGTSMCEVIHVFRTFDPILTPTYTLNQLYEMSDEEFLALDGAQDLYSQIEADVNSVYEISDIVEYGGISGHISAEYSDYSANVTEQSIEELLGDTVNYYIDSPINIEIDDLFYEYQFDVFFTDMQKSASNDEITEEDIMKMAKCYYCVNQVIDVYYWNSLDIGMPAPGNEPILTGDANFDKSVDVYDAIWISNYIVEVYNFTDSQKVIADVNDDGIVDVGDAVGVAMYVLNAESNPLE